MSNASRKAMMMSAGSSRRNDSGPFLPFPRCLPGCSPGWPAGAGSAGRPNCDPGCASSAVRVDPFAAGRPTNPSADGAGGFRSPGAGGGAPGTGGRCSVVGGRATVAGRCSVVGGRSTMGGRSVSGRRACSAGSRAPAGSGELGGRRDTPSAPSPPPGPWSGRNGPLSLAFGCALGPGLGVLPRGGGRGPDGLPALPDAGPLAPQLAQVVELGPADPAPAHHLELADRRRVDGEGPFDPDAEGHLADGERLAKAPALAADDHSLEHLDALATALDHPHVHLDGVARTELRQVVAQARAFDEIDLVHGFVCFPATGS